MTDLSLRLRGYRVTTAEILYHLPDYPHVLQSFVWQHLDIAPVYPVLRRFLDFWARNIDAKLHSVKVCRTGIMSPNEMRCAVASFRLQ